MDEKDRARLRALCAAATPGPWEALARSGSGQIRASGRILCGVVARADAATMASAVNALPALIDALDAAETRATTAESMAAVSRQHAIDESRAAWDEARRATDTMRSDRAEMGEALDAARAEAAALRARVDDIDARRVRVEEIRLDAQEILGATDHESLTEAARRVVAERDAARVEVERLRAAKVDDIVDRWHASDGWVALHDVLGMTREQYAAWVSPAGAVAAERKACRDIADACVHERRNTLARWDGEGVPKDDERRAWVGCKASEAERIRDAIDRRESAWTVTVALDVGAVGTRVEPVDIPLGTLDPSEALSMEQERDALRAHLCTVLDDAGGAP